MTRNSKIFRWLLRGAFVVALGFSLFFAGKLVLSTFYWSDPAHRDQASEGWMPLGYVARSWHVPREVLAQAAGLGEGDQARRNLDLIAQDAGIPLSQLIDTIETAILTFRAAPHD